MSEQGHGIGQDPCGQHSSCGNTTRGDASAGGWAWDTSSCFHVFAFSARHHLAVPCFVFAHSFHSIFPCRSPLPLTVADSFRTQGGTGTSTDASFTLFYGKFRMHAPRIKMLMQEIEKVSGAYALQLYHVSCCEFPSLLRVCVCVCVCVFVSLFFFLIDLLHVVPLPVLPLMNTIRFPTGSYRSSIPVLITDCFAFSISCSDSFSVPKTTRTSPRCYPTATSATTSSVGHCCTAW